MGIDDLTGGRTFDVAGVALRIESGDQRPTTSSPSFVTAASSPPRSADLDADPARRLVHAGCLLQEARDQLHVAA
jgi:hypothetical protein